MIEWLIVLGIGLVAGLMGGFVGIGGGVLIVPALMMLLGTRIKTAIGTSLAALLPPVGILGAWEYYRHGRVNIPYALLIAAGLMVGVYVGSIWANQVSGVVLRRVFAIFLILIAARMLTE